MAEARPVLWLIAGPEGVGKTTHARRYLRSVAGTERFVNLDEIARGFSPPTPTPDAETAAAATRAVLTRSAENIAARRNFARETTLAGRTHLRTLGAAKRAGFAVNLLFCILPDIEVALRAAASRAPASISPPTPRVATCGGSSTRGWPSRASSPPARRPWSPISASARAAARVPRRSSPACRG
ncbi:AAA family ATPase [Falsiroseomonas oryziterrae]|uniref:AAA family ATPase n=1 Tax=Falsiroseomonas oryziterrae TaxID=2911368 RepID=UPI0035582BB3